MSKERNIDTLPLDGGILCFDFINTVGDRTDQNPYEYLKNYQGFVLWCHKVDITEDTRLNELAAHAAKNRQEAETALIKIRKIRDNLYALFSSIAAQKTSKLNAKVLKEFNLDLSDSLSHIQFKKDTHHLKQIWSEHEINLYEPVWIVMKSAYDLLMADEYSRIKECGSSGCGWLFLDQTKNNKRRWCNSSTCGSIEKLKRYYRKKKSKTHQ